MIETHEIVPAPRIPDPERLRNPEYTIRAVGPHGICLLHFDPRTGCAAMFDYGTSLWLTWSPLAFQAFAHLIHERGITVDNDEALARWVLACDSRAHSDATLN